MPILSTIQRILPRRAVVAAPAKSITTLNFHQFFDRYFSAAEDGTDARFMRSSEPFRQVAWVYACVRRIATAMETLPFYVVALGGEGEPIERGPVAELLRRPSPILDPHGLFGLTSTWLDLEGEAHWEVVLDGSRLTQLYVHSPRQLTPILEQGQLAGWKLQAGGAIRRIPIESIVTFRYVNPFAPLRGLSPLEAARMSVDMDYASLAYNQHVLANGGAIGGSLSTEQPLVEEQVERIREELDKKHRGVKQAAKPLILHSGVRYDPTSWSPEEMMLDQLRRMTREEICAVFGVPPILVGVLDDASYANFEQASKTFWQDRIQPVAAMIARQLTEQLCARYQPGTQIEVDWSVVDELGENLEGKLEQAEKLRDLGYTLNQINDRLDLGMDTVAWGNAPLVPTTVQSLERATTVTTLPSGPGTSGVPPADGARATGGTDRAGANHLLRCDAPYIAASSFSSKVIRDAMWKRIMDPQERIERRMAIESKDYYRAARAAVLTAFPAGVVAGKTIDFGELKAIGPGGRIDDALKRVQPTLSSRLAPLIRLALTVGAAQVEQELPLTVPELVQRLRPFFARYLAASQLRITQTVVRGTLRNRLADAVAGAIAGGENLDGVREAIKDAFRDRSIIDPSRIARTESGSALNNARVEGLISADVEEGEWLTARDSAVRDSHAHLDGMIRPLGATFPNGMRWPHDLNGTAEEIINCRCTVVAARIWV